MAIDLAEEEIFTFLMKVESGEIVLVPQEEPQDVYAGNVHYAASNGWSITIFNDCNEWDYIDHIQTDDGRKCDFNTIWEVMPTICNYHPRQDLAWARYRIPGYPCFRCANCGQDSRDVELIPGPRLLCLACKATDDSGRQTPVSMLQ